MKRKISGLILSGMLTASMIASAVFTPLNINAQEFEEEAAILEEANEAEELADADSGLLTNDESIEISEDAVDDAFADLNDSVTPDAIEEDELPDPYGYVYAEETKYNITFLILRDGTMGKYVVPNNLSSAGSITSAVSSSKLNEITQMCGENTIYYWKVGVNGHHEIYLTSDFKDESTSSYYQFKPGIDYTLTAQLVRPLGDNIYVEAIPSVYYDGRSHVSVMDDFTDAMFSKSINDLAVRVFYLPDGEPYENAVSLRSGKDYKITYKNNVNASMKMNDDGTYEPLAIPDKKRPYVQLTGLNDYAGFSTEVYYDILPFNFGEKSQVAYYDYGKFSAEISGLDSSYTLNNGKLNKQISPKVTLYNSRLYKSVLLKSGKDYEVRLYRYNESGKWIYKEKVDEAGRWLCTVRGKGNFCGTVFGQERYELNTIFNDGTHGSTLNPAVYDYKGSDVPVCQFRVDDGTKDISKAKLTVAKSSVPYKHGIYYTSSDLGIKVTLGGYTLTEGTDYRVVFDGADYLMLAGYNFSTKAYYTPWTNAEFTGKIWMANKYTLRIEAIPGNSAGYYGTLNSKKTVSVNGVKIKPAWFKLSTANKAYDGSYESGGKFWYDPRMDVADLTGSVDTYMSGSYNDSGDYRTYNYLKGAEALFNSSYSSKYNDYGVLVFSPYEKLPGSFARTVVPFGPGVDHSYMADVGFKITSISMKDAVNKNIIKIVSASDAVYNAGGAVPSSVTVYFNGNNNNLSVHHNNETFSITDRDGDTLTVKLTASNNTAPGMGSLGLTVVDNYSYTPIKGSASKIGEGFKILPLTVNSSTIKVLKDSDYQIVYGKRMDAVKVSASEPMGTIYAVTQSVQADKSGKMPAKARIDLYQSYYADAEGYYYGRAMLKKLSATQYELTGTSLSAESFNVTVSNGKAGASKTGLDFGSGIKLGSTYDVYGNAAKITSITFTYKGSTYTLPADAKTFAADYKGVRVEFDSVDSVKISTKEDGEIAVPVSDCIITYGDNVKAGKNAGTVTVTLKKGSSGFKYGGSATFKFNINQAKKVTM